MNSQKWNKTMKMSEEFKKLEDDIEPLISCNSERKRASKYMEVDLINEEDQSCDSIDKFNKIPLKEDVSEEESLRKSISSNHINNLPQTKTSINNKRIPTRMTPEFKLSSEENSQTNIKKRASTTKFKVGLKKGGGAKLKI